MFLNTLGTHFDFIQAIEGAGLTNQQINIIESNLATQINVKVGYTKLSWGLIDGKNLPILVEKYENSSMLNKLYTVSLTYLNGKPDVVTIVNEDDNITESVTLTFVDGLLTTVEKI